jgi:hypothetical protein
MASRYEKTPIKEFYRDIWVPLEVPENANDYEYVIPPDFDERPDLLSFELYGTPDLWWIFALRNLDELVDPIGDFKSGLTIMIPSTNTLEFLY